MTHGPIPRPQGEGERWSFRSVFISDLHLGSRASQADQLLTFLRRVECDFLFLVGDLVDDWPDHVGTWPRSHRDVLRELWRKVRGQQTQVVYLAGNHDHLFHRQLASRERDVMMVREFEHRTLDGRRFLVLHGDHFDLVNRRMRWLGKLGEGATRGLDGLCRLLDILRGASRRGELAFVLKRALKSLLGYTSSFERRAAAAARGRCFDGIICGHVHQAALVEMDGVLYSNGGDWVQSCTALVEHTDGRLELLECRESQAPRAARG